MWSPSSSDLENFELDLDTGIVQAIQKFEPTPYIFTKIEKGRKAAVDPTSVTPPSIYLLDHTIAVIWRMFRIKPTLLHFSIDDLKWAYEFLKRVTNKKGESPPDVKVCLSQIQDHLINLYANSTNGKETYFDEIAAVFGEEIMEDSTDYCKTATERKVLPKGLLSKGDNFSFSPRRAITNSVSVVHRCTPRGEETKESGKTKVKYSKKTISLLEQKSNLYEEMDTCGEEEEEELEVDEDDTEVEKYVMSLFKEDKKEKPLKSKSCTKSMIPKKKQSHARTKGVTSSQDTSWEITKNSKRVHCFAEMRRLKFQKSTKVKDTNGEEAAYSDLKAEIQRLTINPKVPRKEVMKFVKEWRSEQMDRLNNELKRLSSIEEFMKSLNPEEVQPNRMSHRKVKELNVEKENYSWRKRLFS